MTGTYLSERHGDHYQVWYIDADGDSELIAEGLTSPHQVADVEADHRRTTEQQKENLMTTYPESERDYPPPPKPQPQPPPKPPK